MCIRDRANSDVYLPKAGYPADYNNYENGLVGYTTSQNDILTGGWSTDGSDKSNVVLKSDNGGKYLSLSRELTGNSSYINNNVGPVSYTHLQFFLGLSQRLLYCRNQCAY